MIADYKYKLTKAEQEIASLQASLARSETQVIRYKSTADVAEKVEAELKVERRKLQREVHISHVQFAYNHLHTTLFDSKMMCDKLEFIICDIFSPYLFSFGTNVIFNRFLKL